MIKKIYPGREPDANRNSFVRSRKAAISKSCDTVPLGIHVCPASQVKRRPSAARLLPAPTQMALCLRLACYDF